MDGRRTSLPEGTPPIGAPAVARRRILKGGAAGVPVLLTLASRPVLGTTCSTASAYGSLTGSHAASQHMACAGRSPTTWASSETWPAPYYPTTKNGSNGYDATAYHCLTTGLLGASFEGKTLLDVMKLSDDGAIRTLGRYTAAGLLNARSGLTPVCTEATVRNMWNELHNRGYYEPTAGARWNAAQIIAYLQSTIG